MLLLLLISILTTWNGYYTKINTCGLTFKYQFIYINNGPSEFKVVNFQCEIYTCLSRIRFCILGWSVATAAIRLLSRLSLFLCFVFDHHGWKWNLTQIGWSKRQQFIQSTFPYIRVFFLNTAPKLCLWCLWKHHLQTLIWGQIYKTFLKTNRSGLDAGSHKRVECWL